MISIKWLYTFFKCWFTDWRAVENLVTKHNDFELLNHKIVELVRRFNELKEKNSGLEKIVSEYAKEREATKKNIENIINKIEELEVGD